MKNVYRTANDSLTNKAVASEGARARAQQLLHRANKITGETKSRLDEIQGKFKWILTAMDVSKNILIRPKAWQMYTKHTIKN